MHRSALLLGLRRGPSGHLDVSTFYAHGTAAEVTNKWKQRLSGAQADIQAGVNRVSEAPGIAAAQARQKWLTKLQDPAIQDKWANNVSAVSLQQWKDSMLNYGVTRVAQGAEAKAAKFQAIMSQLLPFIDNGKQTIAGMPSTTYADREQRMLAWSRYMRSFSRTG